MEKATLGPCRGPATVGSKCPEVPPLVLGEPSIPYKGLFITWQVGEGALACCTSLPGRFLSLK